MRYTFAPGELVYINTRSGLVPAKILGRRKRHVRVQITGGRSHYRRGQVSHHDPQHILPRKAVRIRGHRYLIAGFGTPSTAELPALD